MRNIYKHIPDLNIALLIASGIYRFYELTKYKNMEDKHGRTDITEGSLSFEEDEAKEFPHKLPLAKFTRQDGCSVSFSCISIKPGETYLKQYFIFCTSNSKSKKVMKDSKYIVELSTDVFDFLEKFILPTKEISNDGRKMFSHGKMKYYDIHNYPGNISNEVYKEIYSKHKKFQNQDEYRASIFISDSYFNRVQQGNINKVLKITLDGEKFDSVDIHLNAGIDQEGWRYIEIDTRDLQKKLNIGLDKIIII